MAKMKTIKAWAGICSGEVRVLTIYEEVAQLGLEKAKKIDPNSDVHIVKGQFTYMEGD